MIGRKTAALPMADKTRRPADGIKEPGAVGGDKAGKKDPMYGGDKGVNKILNVRIYAGENKAERYRKTEGMRQTVSEREKT